MSTTQRRDAFAHTKAGHCGSGSLRDLLQFHGLDYGAGPLSEGAAFGLAGGLGFFYSPIPDLTPPFYLVGRTAAMEEDVAAHLGLGLEIRETDDPDEGWAWVRDAVDAGQPPVVWADIMDLEYLRVRMHNSRHLIVVVDYDADAGVAYISDNDRDELQACSLTSLAAARSSQAFPGPNRHRTYLYAWPTALPDPAVAVRAALATAVSNMTAGGAAVGGLPGGTGLEGVTAFAEDYARWPDTIGADGLETALKGLWVFIVKAGTGGAMFRSLHARFLRDMSDLLGDAAGLGALADLYDELSAAWVALAQTATDGDHAGGLPHVADVGRLEREGVAAMQAWLAASAGAS